MRLRLIRNATVRLEYAGRTILIDPMLSPAGTMEPFAAGPRNPTVPLAMPVEEVVDGLDGVVVSHGHPDHFDAAATERIAKDVPILAQDDCAGMLRDAGFEDVRTLGGERAWLGLDIERTEGRHGLGAIGDRMGPVSGFVLRDASEPGLLWAGDTVWCDEVRAALLGHEPEVVVVHAGGAMLGSEGPIIMDAEQVLQVVRAAPEATVVATHLEALDHCPVTRAGLRAAADAAGIPAERLRIPADGETVMA